LFTDREIEYSEEKGRIIGGESIFGKLALMRVKLGLTEKELMESSWISLQLQMYDYPYYNYSAKNVITGKQANEYLNKYIK